MGMDDEIDAVIRESSQGSKGGWNAGGRVSSSNGAGGPIDMGGMDDFIFDDFGGGDERRVGETLEEKVEREKHEASLQRADGSFVRRVSCFSISSSLKLMWNRNLLLVSSIQTMMMLLRKILLENRNDLLVQMMKQNLEHLEK